MSAPLPLPAGHCGTVLPCFLQELGRLTQTGISFTHTPTTQARHPGHGPSTHASPPPRPPLASAPASLLHLSISAAPPPPPAPLQLPLSAAAAATAAAADAACSSLLAALRRRRLLHLVLDPQGAQRQRAQQHSRRERRLRVVLLRGGRALKFAQRSCVRHDPPQQLITGRQASRRRRSCDAPPNICTGPAPALEPEKCHPQLAPEPTPVTRTPTL